MNRNDRTNEKKRGTNKTRTNTKGRKKDLKIVESSSRFDDEGRDNNPAWYFLDRTLADQVSQLSFQQLAGYSISTDVPATFNVKVANIENIYLNPCPGVQLGSNYSSSWMLQKSGINLAGFRLFSKLSAYTGRQATYGPQDISTMILAFGELISVIEWVRRAFGVCYTMNMRNRDYPRKVIENMSINAEDLFANRANYITEFNKIITRVNQLPIPKSIAYFDKCAALYEKIYLDSPSAMAQTIMMHPATTWALDETSYSGGTVLKTTSFVVDEPTGSPYGTTNLSYFLGIIDRMIDLLMSSSTLQVVFTDLLNLATKTNAEFWKFDYLRDDYAVFPEYNQNFLLQIHNMTITGLPNFVQAMEPADTSHVTPHNDVYPNANDNALYYNPAFPCVRDKDGVTTNRVRIPKSVIIDMLTDSPTVEDRIEVMRFSSAAPGTVATYGHDEQTANCFYDTVLPDHYVVAVGYGFTSGAGTIQSGTISPLVGDWGNIIAAHTQIDWSHMTYFCENSGAMNSNLILSDLNYYTVVDDKYLRRLDDFVGLALYDMR